MRSEAATSEGLKGCASMDSTWAWVFGVDFGGS